MLKYNIRYVFDDERICPKTHDFSDVYLSSRRNTRDGRTSRVSSSNCVVTIELTYEIRSIQNRISRFNGGQSHYSRAETLPCTLLHHRRSCLWLSVYLGIVHNETRYPRLVSRPIKQLGEERSGKIGLQRTLAEYRGNDPLRSAVPRVHVQVWTFYTQSPTVIDCVSYNRDTFLSSSSSPTCVEIA